jgi:hypothetical protein
VYDWMVRSLKAWDRVGSRKQFLKALSTRVSGRGLGFVNPLAL